MFENHIMGYICTQIPEFSPENNFLLRDRIGNLFVETSVFIYLKNGFMCFGTLNKCLNIFTILLGVLQKIYGDKYVSAKVLL